ncbi:hypothetical protein RJT34_21781 [Clitoria ternatea]|uniref:Uncharacterized protein n=1 Tax=Clitoria ternatea TaxID=43366 RepID=A0AAN9P6M4_CLITE
MLRMLSGALGLSHKPQLLSRALTTTLCRQRPRLHFQTRSSSSSSSLHLNPFTFNNHTLSFTRSPPPFPLLRLHNSRFSAAASTGSGGRDGGSDGSNSGGSGGGDGGDGDGGDKWSFLSWYLALLAKYPVPVKALTSALLTLIGDLVCQLVIDQVQSLDFKRTLIFTLLGFTLVGLTLHFWYLYLSKLVTLPGASGAVLRLVLDQFLFSPIFIGVFLATLVTLEGKPSQAVPKLKQEWFSAVLANWQLWIPFQFLNFRFVPQQFQVLAANVIALVWNVILSFKAHKEVLPK